ncbi:MAG: D-Ala-D-Ala carboxypeptidase family metallohydrolase [Candidatus Gastranaerophilaceae bacterium]
MTDLNFKMSELITSDTANIRKINNMPDINSLDAMLDLIVFCLQPLRERLKKPVIITSGYRSHEVNKLVGGAQNSQHTKGQAVDIVVKGLTPAQLTDFIAAQKDIPFDQLINEYDRWTHISYVRGKNRRQRFKIN